MSSLPFAELTGTAGFQCDPRFTTGLLPQGEPDGPGDPLGRAWEDGHAAGYHEAQTAARQLADAEASARGTIELALARLNAELAEQLRQKLLATVEALCENCLAPLAIDHDALTSRVARAAAMLARADDERVLRLHPGDLKLIAKQLPQDLDVLEDSSLERGALRIETAGGGVEDGPAHWRRAIAEALAQC